jgi:3-methyladenine DNA glycosylase AlkC
MAGFFYLPHGYFIAEHGLEDFEPAMRANYELTKRFTAEFSIRPFLVHQPDKTLARLTEWTTDPNVHVRRLVSEGTRPRLPWASRLDVFIADPAPVISLLEQLRDDPVEYVRRSVANNLNDIAKDHPDLVIEVCERWWSDGDENRRRLVRHAMRTLVKQGDPRALEVLGYRAGAPVAVDRVSIEPDVVAIGGRVRIEVDVVNTGDEMCAALVDLRVGFVGSNRSIRPKVFKGRTFELEPGASGRVRKTISVAQHSTRKHYAGTHPVEVLVNGVAHEAGAFALEV